MQLINAFLAAVGFVGTVFGIFHWYFSSQREGANRRRNAILLTLIASVVCVTFLFEYLSPALANMGSSAQQHSKTAAQQTSTPSQSSGGSPLLSSSPNTTLSGGTATAAVTASPSQTPSSTTVASGTVLYSANWSAGMAGWTGGTEWKASQNMLLSDGSNCCGGPESIVLAPYQLWQRC